MSKLTKFYSIISSKNYIVCHKQWKVTKTVLYLFMNHELNFPSSIWGLTFQANIKLTGKLKSIVKWIMVILTILIIAGIKMEIKKKRRFMVM